ncbi:uncharacterized protein NECHADRAFT_77095 [Fusarium vanettenii 77-13-4]|uniref:Uncharacterized protein n=1 Tax=Fusarium vanettenii (strain ATCC MYA-4622 / CBS 123669 / FGSC 9596 / NRRL 45880 / 77-13-4) TaxID=660122 RepID=C7ZCL7_FUSV7|nr:uncharacterized protein NECHADRAFT_77095 [Fusarium vanettenii 77-13-4]EEU38389.1 hypothetical protein NECHADRAFT_77095 [Fusarium vanettenii 77-13-4]
MPALEQTITIVNNSGKIIKTGKQLYSIFKDAQGTYKEKKAEIKSEKALQRSQSFDPHGLPPQQPRYVDDDAHYFAPQQPRYIDDGDRYYPPRAFDQRSQASSRRSGRSRSVTSQSRRPRDDYYDTRSRPALTMDNLKTHSEVSSVTPSRAPPRTYQNPYAETIPMDLALPPQSQLARVEMRSVAPSAYGPGGGAMVQRNRSTGELVKMKPHKEIDMDLAYGNIPPDLADRTDLDPQYGNEKEAKALVHRVEGILTEAKCLHHSATTTMAQLQKDPDSAAAVALSLAELSKLVKKSSPAFLMLLKSGSPAVFSLLSSPHFLIGTSIAVGVTVVCFGGWKIVQRVKEQQAAREALMYEPMDRPAPMRTQSEYAPRRAPTEYSAGMDEALIIEDDLSEVSSIETWRRGIVPFGEDETADMELITPLANKENVDRYGDDFDVKSRRSTRTTKTNKTSKTTDSHRSHRSHRSDASERSHRSHRSRRDDESIADSERSHRSSRSKRSERIETRSIDSRDSRSRKDDLEVVLRPKAHRNSNNMLKALFKSKEKKERERELVMA